MFIRKLSSTAAFVAVDLADCPGHGVVRSAPKILQGGAKDLARSMTYTLACLERQETGISAGISTPKETKTEAIKHFVTELADWDAGYFLTAGKGVAGDAIASVDQEAVWQSVVAAAQVLCPEATTAVTDLPDSTGLVAALADTNISLVASEEPFTAEADLLFVGSKIRVLDHDMADQLKVKTVVPITRLALTTRALARCTNRGVVVAPDFISAAGALLGTEVVSTTHTLLAELVDHPAGPVIGACLQAEKFLQTWQDSLPFGRPL